MARVIADDLKGKKLLLIIGEQKCGTTSLFDYLAAHPNVFASNRKQTFFFMPDSFQNINKTEVPIKYSEDPDEFLKLFPGYSGAEDYLLEATPDYLHTQQALERIRAFEKVFEEIIILIVLRDPIQRFRSWFNFAKQQKTIEQSTTLTEFYRMNRPVEESYVSFDSCFFALETGMYEKNIPAYTEVFGSNVRVYSFEDMKENAGQFMSQVSHDVGLDGDFYKDFEFKASNVTVSSRFSILRVTYMGLRAFYFRLFGERLRYYLRPVKNTVSGIYHKLNDKKANSENGVISKKPIFNKLKTDYRETYKFCDESFNIRWCDK
jgi:hypothetical protein